MKLQVRCEYGDHECDAIDLCYYTDTNNNIADNTPTCRGCYEKHVLKYYPDSRIAEHIKQEQTT